MASAKLAPRAISRSVLNFERITSTSGSCATGLKKCSPISRLGLLSPSAIRSSSIEDVLVARMAPGLARASASTKIFCLISSFSTTASMITSARARPLPVGSASSRAMAVSTSVFDLSRFLNSVLARVERRLDPLHVEILQRHAHAAQRAPGRDIAAHHAGADHMHPAEHRLVGAAHPLLLERLRTGRTPGAGWAPCRWPSAARSRRSRPALIAFQSSPCFLEQIDQRDTAPDNAPAAPSCRPRSRIWSAT